MEKVEIDQANKNMYECFEDGRVYVCTFGPKHEKTVHTMKIQLQIIINPYTNVFF